MKTQEDLALLPQAAAKVPPEECEVSTPSQVPPNFIIATDAPAPVPPTPELGRSAHIPSGCENHWGLSTRERQRSIRKTVKW